MIHDHDSTSIPESDGKGVVVGKNLTSSLWTIPMHYPNGLPKMDYALKLVFRVTKLGESTSI